MNISKEQAPKRRVTKQRRAILEYLRGTTSHPSAATLYEVLRKRMHNISLGTIYRTLGVLQEEGLVLELPYDDFSRYDARTDDHYHIMCLSCGQVADAEAGEAIRDLSGHVQTPGFRVIGHRLELFGYCSQCQDGRL